MKIRRIDHIGIVVKDFAAAKSFFLDFGLELMWEGEMEGAWLETFLALKGVKDRFAFLRTPDGEATIELIQFYTPTDEREMPLPQTNTPGIRHIAFVVEDIDGHLARLKARGVEVVGEVLQFQDSYKLCYVRGPEGIILELAEPLQ